MSKCPSSTLCFLPDACEHSLFVLWSWVAPSGTFAESIQNSLVTIPYPYSHWSILAPMAPGTQSFLTFLGRDLDVDWQWFGMTWTLGLKGWQPGTETDMEVPHACPSHCSNMPTRVSFPGISVPHCILLSSLCAGARGRTGSFSRLSFPWILWAPD
jgi:hypothetical protein